MINARAQKDEFYKDNYHVREDYSFPGTIFPEAVHEETRLYIIAGSLSLKIEDSEAVELKPGDLATINANQPNSVVIGETGCKFLTAWRPEEAAQFEVA
jgi:quercetin dioxygenase-like cupin family protein